MQHNTDTLWNTVTGGAFMSAAYLFGGVDQFVIALMVLMATDYISGLSVAYFFKKNVESKKAFKGLMKKAAMLLAVIVANQLDIVAGSGGHFMRNAMILFLIGMEGISFIENLGHMGVQVPAQISHAFAQLKEDNKETNKADIKYKKEVGE
ncbi:phage holin family protein [Bacillus sp. PK3_68]|uniref:phage holin family protein n=1 Tax=Bacillus sp. PK3_68 TaxID=2027408 RepID=UPI000E726FEC|nr:phage holin family protein [Bacillus sp. PK3_68]RJS59133.1 holin [Bacillus sp. PK3_68]